MDIAVKVREHVREIIRRRMESIDDPIIGLSTQHVRLSLKEPFETAKRMAEVSDTVFVRVTTEHGYIGQGAATPVQYVTGETVESVVAAVTAAKDVVVGRQVRDLPLLAGGNGELAEVIPAAPSARAAIETAILDAAGKIARQPCYRLLGGHWREVETDITIPIVPPEHARELAAEAALWGFTLLKVKVSAGDHDQDIDRIMEITRAAPHAELLLDANQGFKPAEAVSFLQELSKRGTKIAVFEQPVDRDDIEGLAYVTRNVSIPVFVDESVCKPEDVERIAAAGAASGVNIKLMKSGIVDSLTIAGICRRLGLGLMLGCMVEPRAGITAALHIACAVRGFERFDLDADLLLAEEGAGGFARTGARIHPIRSPSLGCPLEP